MIVTGLLMCFTSVLALSRTQIGSQYIILIIFLVLIYISKIWNWASLRFNSV